MCLCVSCNCQHTRRCFGLPGAAHAYPMLLAHTGTYPLSPLNECRYSTVHVNCAEVQHGWFGSRLRLFNIYIYATPPLRLIRAHKAVDITAGVPRRPQRSRRPQRPWRPLRRASPRPYVLGVPASPASRRPWRHWRAWHRRAQL